MHPINKKILLAFDDPGGGLAVSSLIENINKEINAGLVIYAGKHSRGFVNGKDLENAEVRDISSFIEREEAEEIIDNKKPDIIITGTGGGNAEQEFRNVALKKNIKSIVVLDFWKDYLRRWKYAEYSLEEMKDKICVMDEQTKDEMMEENFKADNIIVTGHPYLDKIFNQNLKCSPVEKGSDKIENILFLSQPLSIIGVNKYDIHPLKIFLNSVTQFADRNNQKLKVNIKLHPSEQESDEILKLTKKFSRGLLEVGIIKNDNSLNELITNCDLAAGYNSIALFEACAAGKRVISLKVAEIKNSLKNAMEYVGIEIVEPDSDSIFKRINEYKKETTDLSKFSGGIEKCLNLIKKELSII